MNNGKFSCEDCLRPVQLAEFRSRKFVIIHGATNVLIIKIYAFFDGLPNLFSISAITFL